MDNQKPTAKPYIFGLILFLIVGGIIGGLITYKVVSGDKEAIQSEEEAMKGIDSSRDTFPIVGTGTNINGGVASSTARSTIFQFASSTDETYWDTSNDWPNLCGSTSTVRFLNRKADLITINGVFKGAETASSFVFEIAGSNSAGCNNASSTTNMAVNWYPMPFSAATSTPTSAIIIGEDGTNTISPGSTASTTFAFTIRDVNYTCTRMKFYNNSTTDESLLYVEATLKEN